MIIELGLPEISIGVILLGAVQFLVTLWVSERLKASLQKENAVFLEKIRWDIKVREQAERTAEYLSIARDLKESDSPKHTDMLIVSIGNLRCGFLKICTKQ